MARPAPRRAVLAVVAVVVGLHASRGFLGGLVNSAHGDFQGDFPTQGQASSLFTGHRPGARTVHVIMKAGAEEESLQSAIKGGNKDRIQKAIEGLPDPGKSAMKEIEGDWQVTWDSGSLGPTKKTLLKLVCDQLPNTMVEFYRQYNLIQDGKYYWLQAFTMDGIQRTNAALLMSGPFKAGKGNTGTVDFNEVQIVPSRHGSAESREAIRSTGLDRYMKPLKLKDGGKVEVTVHYVSDETLVQEDEVGNTYVFKRMSDSYPVPYIFADKKAES
ncbi:unnamed protein product [Symbiodinium natans]|uniref:Plastid lipid-associated protein/fibrillin conserved domain-containing protein n=1 Tax=Symbiodinium natans TaxID=878477 RepID=A0A812JCP1_9DINO|nr:unnamed protein product [Symbiodinium natans]